MNLYQQIASNKRRSMMLMVLALLPLAAFLFVTALLLALLFHAGDVLLLALAVSLAASIAAGAFVYSRSCRLLLRSCWAAPAHGVAAGKLEGIVERLAADAGIHVPTVYVTSDDFPNAFSIGMRPKRSFIVVNRGLIEKLEEEELTAVMAHEISHIRNFDTMAGTLLAGFIMAPPVSRKPVRFASNGSGNGDGSGSGEIQRPAATAGRLATMATSVGARLARAAFSKDREYAADASAAVLIGDPAALASALEKIENDPATPTMLNACLAPLYVVNPLDRFAWKKHMVDTHPPLDRRIRILRAMSGWSDHHTPTPDLPAEAFRERSA